MTITHHSVFDAVIVDKGVYAPQEDSRLLIDALSSASIAAGRRVLDLCTGSGVVAIAAAQLGAASVTAFDICPRAVSCSRANADMVGVDVGIRLGTLDHALAAGPFDLVVCNPPYVPMGPDSDTEAIPSTAGRALAWNAGRDGRELLGPLCEWAPTLLAEGGTLMLVQSEFAGIEESLQSLRSSGLDAEIVAQQWIPFGPVLSARARWLEHTGRLPRGRRYEQIAVIRADKR